MNVSELRQQLELKSKALATFEIGDTLTVEREQEFTVLEKDVNDIVSKIETLERIEKTKLETAERLNKIATPSISEKVYATPKVKTTKFFNSDEDAELFAKSLLRTKSSQSNDTQNAGGLVAPPQVASIILAPDLTYGVARTAVNFRPMGRDIEDIIIVDPTVLSFQHRAETANATDQTMNIITKSLVSRNFGFSVPVTNELINTSLVSIADTVTDLTRRALNRKFDELVFNYTGTQAQDQIRGIPAEILALSGTVGNITNVVSVATWAGVTLADLNTLKARVPAEGLAGAAWYCSPAAYAQIFLRLFQAGGGNTVATISDSGVMTFLGHPIVLVDAMTSIEAQNTPAILFGNLRNSSTLGVQNEMTMIVDSYSMSKANTTVFNVFSRMTHIAYNLGTANATASLRRQGYVSLLFRAGS